MKKRLRASRTATRVQPYFRWSSGTNNVQEYWKLATATMPMMPAVSCTQRLRKSDPRSVDKTGFLTAHENRSTGRDAASQRRAPLALAVDSPRHVRWVISITHV